MTTAAPAQERTTVAKPTKGDWIRNTLEERADVIATLLPRHFTPERMIAAVLVAATRNEKLFQCTKASLLLSVLRVAQWGLDIGRTAHLVPFKTKQGKLICEAIPDYRGLIELCINSRHVRKMRARAVYEGEHFRAEYGLADVLEHIPHFAPEKRTLTHVYCVAWLRGGESTFEVMSRAEVEAIRAGAPSKDSDAWKKHFDEMAKKTVVRRLTKQLPQTPQLQDALGADDGVAPMFERRVASQLLLPADAPGAFSAGADEYGGTPSERLDPATLAADEGGDVPAQEQGETRTEADDLADDRAIAAQDAARERGELPLGDRRQAS